MVELTLSGSDPELAYAEFIIGACMVSVVMIMVCWCGIVQLQLYTLCPGWGPICKFDSDGNEDMRIAQLLMHEQAQGHGSVDPNAKEQSVDALADKMGFLQGILDSAHGEAKAMMKEHGEKFRRLGGHSGDEEAPLLPNPQGIPPGADNGMYSGFQQVYGSIGKCTWGYCESPVQWGEERWDPQYGKVVVRHGFADTQWMRRHSRTWARDELACMKKDNMSFPPLSLGDSTADLVEQRMVVERNGM